MELNIADTPRSIDEHVDPLPDKLKMTKEMTAPRSRGLDDDDDDGGLPSPAVMKAQVAAMKAKKGGSTNAKETTPPPTPVMTIVAHPPKEVTDAHPDIIPKQKLMKDLISGYVYAKVLQKVYKEDSEKYKSTDMTDMVGISSKIARHTFNFYQKGLGSILPATKIAYRTLKKKTEIFKLHDEILTDLFKGFMLAEGDLSQLDSMLNSFMKSLKGIDITIETSSQKQTNSLVVVSYTPTVLSVKDGDGVKIPYKDLPPEQRVWETQVRVLIFDLTDETYKWSVKVNKESVSHEMIDFNMTWIDFNGSINEAVFEDYKDWLKMKQEDITHQVTKYLDETEELNQRTVRSGDVIDKDTYMSRYKN